MLRGISSYVWGEDFKPDPFKVELGPFNRVQNVKKLIEYRDASKVNKNWVYSPKEGPFRVLGEDRISKIVNEQSNLDPILRLNDAASQLFRQMYKSIRLHLKDQNNPPPQLPIRDKSVLDMSKFSDSEGETLLARSLEDIVFYGATDFSAIDRFISLGGDINLPFSFYWDFKHYEAPAFSYLWLLHRRDQSNEIMKVIDYLITKGATVNQTFGSRADNVLSVMISTFSTPTSMVPWYLKNGGDINFTNADGNSFLHLALFMPGWTPPSDINIAEICIANNIDVSLVNKQGDHPIHLLCHYYGNAHEEETAKLLKTILEKAPNELHARDNENHTPLYWCIRTGKKCFIDTILAKTGEVEVNTEGYIKDAKNYLNAFADFIFDDARQFDYVGDTQVFSKELIEKKINEVYMPLMKSMLPFVGQTPEGLRALLIANEGSTTLLHHLAKCCPWILDHLLTNGYILQIDLQLKNGQGDTVESIGNKTTNSFLLSVACYNLDKDAVKKLIDKDLSLDLCVGYRGQSFLHLAIQGCVNTKDDNDLIDNWNIGFKIFKKLLVRKVDPNLGNNDGDTPLLSAINSKIEYANPFILELLDYGAKTDQPNKDGMTPRERIKEFRGWDIVNQAILGAST